MLPDISILAKRVTKITHSVSRKPDNEMGHAPGKIRNSGSQHTPTLGKRAFCHTDIFPFCTKDTALFKLRFAFFSPVLGDLVVDSLSKRCERTQTLISIGMMLTGVSTCR